MDSSSDEEYNPRPGNSVSQRTARKSTASQPAPTYSTRR